MGVVATLVAGGSAVSLRAQGPAAPPAAALAPTRIDVSALGPQVGRQVPDFSLRDQTGKTWTRQSILGSKGALLVFFRSADW